MTGTGQATTAKEREWRWGTPRQIGRQLGWALLGAALWAMLLGILVAPRGGEITSVSPGEALTWDGQIYPLLQRHCVLCHGNSGGLSLASYEQALRGGRNGPSIVPGNAEASLLYRTLLGPADGIPQMPLGQAQLSPEEIGFIRDWINQLPAANP